LNLKRIKTVLHPSELRSANFQKKKKQEEELRNANADGAMVETCRLRYSHRLVMPTPYGTTHKKSESSGLIDVMKIVACV